MQLVCAENTQNWVVVKYVIIIIGAPPAVRVGIAVYYIKWGCKMDENDNGVNLPTAKKIKYYKLTSF